MGFGDHAKRAWQIRVLIGAAIMQNQALAFVQSILEMYSTSNEQGDNAAGGQPRDGDEGFHQSTKFSSEG